MVEALIGRTLSGVDPVQPVPSLDRELFDSVNDTTHRFGLNAGQAFVDKDRGVSTVLAELQDPEYDLFPIDREERRAKISSILEKARQDFTERSYRKEIDPSKYPNCFCFSIDGVNICEKAYANALGLSNDKGAVSKVWKDEVRVFIGTLSRMYNDTGW